MQLSASTYFSINIFNAFQDAQSSCCTYSSDVCKSILHAALDIFSYAGLREAFSVPLWCMLIFVSLQTLKKSRQNDRISLLKYFSLTRFSLTRLAHNPEQSFHSQNIIGVYSDCLLRASASIQQVLETAWDLAVLWTKGSLSNSFLSCHCRCRAETGLGRLLCTEPGWCVSTVRLDPNRSSAPLKGVQMINQFKRPA